MDTIDSVGLYVPLSALLSFFNVDPTSSATARVLSLSTPGKLGKLFIYRRETLGVPPERSRFIMSELIKSFIKLGNLKLQLITDTRYPKEIFKVSTLVHLVLFEAVPCVFKISIWKTSKS